MKFNKGGEILHAKSIRDLHGDESRSTKTSIGTRAIVPEPQGSRSPHQNLVVGVVTDKLSKEYAKLQCTQGISELTRLCEIDFRAGFETAREMCAELFKNSLGNPKYKHQLFDVAVKMISEDLLSVGEEEAL